jgi:DNA-binding NarL/FixJ family response regulator
MSNNSNTILSVGQCGFDNQNLIRFVSSLGCDYKTANSSLEAFKLMEHSSFKIIFVNRIFDRDGGSGLEFIKEVKNKFSEQKILLVSNYQDKQEIAISYGALLGFGKNDLGSKKVFKLVEDYLTM